MSSIRSEVPGVEDWVRMWKTNSRERERGKASYMGDERCVEMASGDLRRALRRRRWDETKTETH